MTARSTSGSPSILRMGVMGCAAIAERSLIPAMQALPERFQVVAVASRSSDKARRVGARFHCEPVSGYERLLEREDIDAVYVPLPTGLHEEWILRTLMAGKHVFAEKSLAVSLESASRIIAAAREHNLLVMEDFMFCHHSQHDSVRRLAAEGQIGELRTMRSSFGFPPLGADNFRYSKALGGGALLDVGAYTLKAAQMFLASDLKVIGAHRTLSPAGVDLAGAALLRDSKGVTAQVAFGFEHFYQCNYELWGSTGKITVERSFTPPAGFAPRVVLERPGKREEFTLPPDDHFRNILTHFSDSVAMQDFRPHWDANLAQAALVQQVQDLCK